MGKDIIFKVINRMSDIPQEEWDHVVISSGHGSVFHSYKWLELYEKSVNFDIRAYHITAYEDNKLTAVCPLFCSAGNSKFDAIIQRSPDVAREITQPILFAQSIDCFYGGFISLSRENEIYRGICGQIDNLLKELNIKVSAVLNIPDTDPDTIEFLREQGYQVNGASAAFTLKIKWSHFEDYIESLSRKKRRNIRKLIRFFDTKEINAVVKSGEFDYTQMIDLTLRTLDKHKLDISNSRLFDYYNNLFKNMGKIGKFLIITGPGDQILCYILFFEFQQSLVAWLGGIDYNALTAYEPYHFAYQYLIKYAIQNKFTVLDLGRSCYEFKRMYGCEPTILYHGFTSSDKSFMPKLEILSRDLSDMLLKRMNAKTPDKKHYKPELI